MIKKGVYAAGLSILNDDLSLDVNLLFYMQKKRLKMVYTVFFSSALQDKAN